MVLDSEKMTLLKETELEMLKVFIAYFVSACY